MVDVETAPDAQLWEDDPIEDADVLPAAAAARAAASAEAVCAEAPEEPAAAPEELGSAAVPELVPAAELPAAEDTGLPDLGEGAEALDELPAAAAPGFAEPLEPEPDAGLKQYLKAVHAALAKHAAKGGMGAIAEVSKRATQAWEGFTELERAPWEAKARSEGPEAKSNSPVRAAGQQVLFGAPKQGDAAAKKKKPEKKKDPNAPKKPVGGAYGVFSSERRAEFQQAAKAKGEKGLAAVAKLTSEAWKALPEEEKKAYEEKSSKLMEDYKAATAAYSENKAPEDAGEAEQDSGVKRKGSPSEKPAKEPRLEPARGGCAVAAAAAKRALFGLPAAAAQPAAG